MTDLTTGSRLALTPLDVGGGLGLILSSGGDPVLAAASPVRLITADGVVTACPYDSLDQDEEATLGRLDTVLPDGTRVIVQDRWSPSPEGDGVLVNRTLSIPQAGSAAGVRAELVVESTVAAQQTDWQFYVTGALYNRNDTDLDGKEDYLGGYVQEYRDDRNGHLAVLAYLPHERQAFSLARTSAPTFDAAISEAELVSGVVITESDIGSLGIVSREGEALALRAGYPFGEEVTFSLETSGRGWAGFLPVREGRSAAVDYELRVFSADDLTEAIWGVTQRQIQRLGTRPAELPLPMEELERHRFLLTQLYYREWDAEEDPRQPAGYMTHFSPRTGETLGSLIEFGFTGAQALHALNAIRRGYREDAPLWTDRARKVLDFFVREMQAENGFSEGIYDVHSKSFVRWFTGILLPFQYSDDDAEARAYLGSQMTGALGPIARALRSVPGNYTRTMCESIYPLLLAYEEERRHGVEQSAWLAAGDRFGAFLLEVQGDDGAWFRGYSPEGEGLTHPVEWFGRSAVEQRSGTIFPIEVLATLHRITGREDYKEAALRAADYITDTFVPEILYCGGLNDTSHIKSVKIDSVGVMFAMRSLIMAHRLGGDQRHLDAALKAAKVLSSWLFLWDVPFPEGSLLDVGGFRSTGWAVCDAIPGGGYVDDEFLEFVGDMLHVAKAAGESRLVDIVEIVLAGMQHGLSIPGNMLGYAAPGIQCEGYMTAYWLSAPEETAFSGAVNKKKGDDNDTCNGLVNAQALYGLDVLRDTFGTIEFSEIRRLMGVTSAGA
ncbi:hypothetical protein [uncultured Cellulomonas sp.]|uniref:hypothetical protein n=1 Tax=uncultured Cellulomonas sp. TaxID=189682 RepID=UPI0026108889|nr:hypothetical protein [uncultured Cellulomonas sp.]